ncbi:hypothetical protein C8R48DRAFT_672823 [Suillus tomentosus]|nr:hypothetical protein C8R48DRAFT_672823 [Suillus tomentosus]
MSSLGCQLAASHASSLPYLLQKSFDARVRLDVCLTYISVTFAYASAIHFKRREPVSSVHLRFLGLPVHVVQGRTRYSTPVVRTASGDKDGVELMAAIYDKPLKRQDYTGIVDKDKTKEAADKRRESSLLKIRIRMTQGWRTSERFLLGLSAFSDFIILLTGWSLNSFVTERNVCTQKGISASRDQYVAVLNEIIGAVKSSSSSRSKDARGVEMNWMMKGQIADADFQSIALFSMIRKPYLMAGFQTGVALKGIEKYLEEDEVNTWELRAVCARRKYVLLDDPLSAVDSRTARFWYGRLFRGPLMANRTVILVAHHVELLLLALMTEVWVCVVEYLCFGASVDVKGVA